jgi:tetratricopeptide (TPR) repeat protein
MRAVGGAKGETPMSALAAALRQTGIAALKEGRLADAVEALIKAAEADPNSFESWSYLGAAYSRMNDYERARKAFGHAIQINHESPRAWYNLGVAHQMAGDPDSARTCYERAIALDPNYEAAHQALEKLKPKAVSMSELASGGGKIRLPGAHDETLEEHAPPVQTEQTHHLTPQELAKLATPDGSFHMPGAQATELGDEDTETKHPD